MASEEPSHTIQSPKDEFEGIEMVDFDPNILRELLYDPEEETEGGGATMQAEAEAEAPGLTMDSYLCVDDIDVGMQDFDWLEMTQETHLTCNYEMESWYGEPCMEDINGFLEMGDYSVSHAAVMSEEIGYIGLWQDN